jgi:hypothetical protein
MSGFCIVEIPHRHIGCKHDVLMKGMIFALSVCMSVFIYLNNCITFTLSDQQCHTLKFQNLGRD